MSFTTFAGSDIEVFDDFDPIVALEQAKREMARGTGPRASEAETWGVDVMVGETELPGCVGNWWAEVSMGAGPRVGMAEARRVDGTMGKMEPLVTVGN